MATGQSILTHITNKSNENSIGPIKQIFTAQNCNYLLIHQFKHVFLTCVLGAQKNRLLRSHNIIMFWLRN